VIVDAEGRELITTEHGARRTPIAAGTPALLGQAVTARAGYPGVAPHPS
jgi:hypothetical protein